VTKIEWTDETWNPVTGCTKVSPGCAHCYAERIAHRFGAKPYLPGKAEIVLHPERLEMPLRWKKPRMIFVNSMSDLFHEDVPDEFLADVLNIMSVAEWHVFQVLTKRPERMQRVLSILAANSTALGVPFWPRPNIWLGASVENQRMADARIPLLLETPAVVRFVSCEPLLGPIDLSTDLLWGRDDGIDWVIVGAESGPKARPMDEDWVRSIRDQCIEAGVPLFYKQRIERGRKVSMPALDGQVWAQYPRRVK